MIIQIALNIHSLKFDRNYLIDNINLKQVQYFISSYNPKIEHLQNQNYSKTLKATNDAIIDIKIGRKLLISKCKIQLKI